MIHASRKLSSLRRTERPGGAFLHPRGRGSTGSPAACHASQPPVRATALGQPALRSSSATRALVASFFQAQKMINQASRGRRLRSASWTDRSGSSRSEPRAVVSLAS